MKIVLFTNNLEIKIPGVKTLKSRWQFLGPLYDFFIFGLQTKGADIVFSPANSGALYTISGKKVSTIQDVFVFYQSFGTFYGSK